MSENNIHTQAAEANFQTEEGKKDFWRATISCWLGTTMEYTDFALYGLAAGIIFGEVFFPESTPVMALLQSFAAFSVGFIARPIGAIVFGMLGDKMGRKFVMVITISLMGLATTCIGLIPSYEKIGAWSAALLVLMRFMQGLGAGAELSGGAVMLGEYAPVKRRGVVSSIIGLGSNSGTLLASAVWLLVLQLDHDDLMSWGWRIPFLGSILIAYIALLIRKHMRETPVFEKQKKQLEKMRKEAFEKGVELQKKDKRSFFARTKAFWVMVGLRIGENGPSYLAQGFIIGYVVSFLSVDKSVATMSVFVASVLGFFIIPFSGWLSDKFGRRITYRWFCILLVLWAFPAFMLLDTKEPWIVGPVIVIGMGLASLGIFGVQAAWGVELFGVTNRYTKMAFAKELGSIMSGGTAPMIASALLSYYGHWWPIATYFAVCAFIGLISTFIAPETRGRDLNLPEDAL